MERDKSFESLNQKVDQATKVVELIIDKGVYLNKVFRYAQGLSELIELQYNLKVSKLELEIAQKKLELSNLKLQHKWQRS